MRQTIPFPGRSPGTPFYLLSASVVFATGILFALEPQPGVVDLGVFLLPALLGLTFTYAGYYLTESDISWDSSLRILKVALGIGIIAALTRGAVMVLNVLNGDPVFDVAYTLLVVGTAGAAVGTPIGYYYHRLQARNRELQRQYDEIQQLHRRVSVSQRVLRHNLRNELTITMGLTGLLADDPKRSDAPDLLQKLRAHQARLRDLAETSQQIHNVWQTSETVDQDVTAIVETVVSDFRDTTPNRSITTDLPGSARVRAHPRLDAAIREAVTNAIEHTPTDSDVHVTVRSHADHDGIVRIEVADTGPGIPELEIEALSQIEETPLSHGRGLGLRLLASVIEQSDGRLGFRSTDPQGVTVVMDLPQAGADIDCGRIDRDGEPSFKNSRRSSDWR